MVGGLERIHQVMCLPECLHFSMQGQALSKLKVRSRSVPVDFHCSSHGPTRTSDGLDMIRVFYGRFPEAEHRKTISVCSLCGAASQAPAGPRAELDEAV